VVAAFAVYWIKEIGQILNKLGGHLQLDVSTSSAASSVDSTCRGAFVEMHLSGGMGSSGVRVDSNTEPWFAIFYPELNNRAE